MPSRLSALGLLLVLTTLPTASSYGAEVTCVDRLQIQGPLAGELRARLRFGRLGQTDSPTCDLVYIKIAQQGNGYGLHLSLGNQKTYREIRSANDAATWVESWLDPIVNDEPVHEPRADSAVSRPNPPPNAAAPDPPTSTSTITLGLGPEFTIGSNGSNTVGPSVFGQYELVPRFWLGMNAGFASVLADGWNRSWIRFSTIVGPTWNMSPRFSLMPGVGIGIYSGRMRDPTSTAGGSMRVGGGFFELLARANYDISKSFIISAALGGRWYAFNSEGKIITQASEPDDDMPPTPASTSAMPSETPLLEFTSMVDICYRFGGNP